MRGLPPLALASSLGVTPAGDGVDIAIPAPGATRLLFCVFEDGTEIARHALPNRRGDVFHGHIPGIAPGTAYGLRAEGPWDRRFNPRKLLLDPWARALEGRLHLHPTAFDTGEEPDPADSGPHLARAIVQAPLPPQDWHPLPARPEVVYELHVRGFTRQHPDIPEAIRGTFAGLAHPAAIAHLTRLGVTLVELLPTAAWVDERHLGPLGLTNYWGYNTVCWLAPDPRLAPGGMAEVRAAVGALRAAGIGVILDIVLNHSGEGDALGPTLSLRGFGNGAWYRLRPGGYVDDTGCGNTMALDQPWPLRLAMDAMRHWAGQAGVDGFRLDLATTLGRRAQGFDPHAPLLAAMRQDPILRARRIIAEPWDLGPDGYQLGNFPHGWPEWNDKFRDDIRRFWRGWESGRLGPLATRLAGSGDIFAGRVADSLNYVTAHDGFTLRDLVSHEHRHNRANGEENRDGAGDNNSWNHGAEGPTDDPAIQARRAGDVRALLATLLSARGLPMISMGDEAGRSQDGNNNAYAQDNATSWFDWAGMDQGLVDFTARLIAARRAHPALHATATLTGGPVDGTGLPDVAWLHADGRPIEPAEWEEARCLVALLHAEGDRVLLACNGGDEALALRLPPARWDFSWRLLADSARPQADTVGELAPRSVMLLAERPSAGRGPEAADPDLLARLAREAGLSPVWPDLEGREHQVPEATLRHILGALGLPAATAAQARDSLARRRHRPPLPLHLAARAGRPTVLALGEGLPARLDLHLTLEDGSRRDLALESEDGRTTLPALPLGRHELRFRDTLCRITAAPPSCFLPRSMEAGRRHLGVTAQSYSLRHAADQGMGDFTAIAGLARRAGAEKALWLGISPPHALHPTERERASPYQPSDRRFLEPMLIDVSRLGGAGDFSGLRRLDSVDYPAVWQAKRRALHAAWTRCDHDDPDFRAFRAAGGAALERFAAFNALAELAGHSDARRWPAGLRHGRDAGVESFCAQEADAVGFHAWLQFLADRQMAGAAEAGAGLYRDLAVGTAPDGAELWSGDMDFLPGLSVGAPPDPLGPLGQVWGVPPLDPVASEATGHAAFAALVRANMRHAAALRIDHVLGLKRLFLVPDGATAAEGCYLDQPFHPWLGEVALESHRASCAVVGEDLGTVPPGLREELQEARLLSYRVLWFERDGAGFRRPQRYPVLAAACISTHDLPTLAGWWEAADIAEREALGLLDAEAAGSARADRLAERDALLAALREAGIDLPGTVRDELPPELAGAIHAYVAATPSLMLLVQAEDLAGERVAVNLPGTDRERPNWRRRLALDAEGVFATPAARAILAGLAGRR
ncbi:glycogen debranching enzyme GlgX [Roseococcus sp. SYP-B2431]|uniref:glycogen debranching protein GlgX n=1 Tax=Roseococcus sp. SYP-B2431 TaxID=2496640 RepID=UPI001039196C|nr:glycogen debranching protein GlgX [Roseococcus sp. SYP-B2431]TCI00544.1 glycogen debranching enzyme GlgX [Roseococcus sp. SYP-B2431]